MSKRKSAFSILEASIVLVIVSVLTTIIVSSTVLLKLARLNAARNITKSSIVTEVSGITLWLDAISRSAFDEEDIEDGDLVTNWHDVKASHLAPYVATQSTDNNKPIYNNSIINNLPGVTFDDSIASQEDFLQISNFRANAYFTLFVVGQFNNADFFIEHGPVVGSNDGFCFWGQGSCLITRTATNVTLTEATNWFGDRAAIGMLRYDGIDLRSRLNNGAYNIQAGVLSNQNLTDTLNIGSRNGTSVFSNGSFGEIIMYDRALNTTEIDNIILYLRSKWKIKY